MPPPTLRDALRDCPPADFSTRAAWREVISGLRAWRRETGQAVGLSGQGPVDRAQGLVPLDGAPVVELKALLRSVQCGSAGERSRAAVEVDAWVARWMPRVREAPVALVIAGWPDDMPPRVRLALVGGDPAALPPLEAASALARLDGLVVAGCRLNLTCVLLPGEVLPPPPRRGHARRGRADPWLPEVDAEGRLSLTPLAIARSQAQRLVVEARCARLIDAFCGCGGNAIAFARAGARVVAVERDSRRAEMARRNVRALGVADRVSVLQGDAERLVPELLRSDPEAALFLDPPWGGEAWDRQRVAWSDLLPDGLTASVLAAPCVALKAPRSFDPATLPPRPGPWRVVYELGQPGSGDAAVIKMLTVLGG